MSVSFKDMTEPGNNLMIVDALNLAFRWKHIGSTDFREDYLSTISSLKRSYKAQYVIITADKGSSSFRKTVSPDYKGNRKIIRDNQTKAEEEAFKAFFREYEESLDHIRQETDYPIIQFQSVEADDLAAYITKKVKRIIPHTWLISTDKDWDLLVSDIVSRFSYVTRKETTVSSWSKIHPEGYTQEEFISIKCLMGDPGDGVAGVPGIGPKRAVQLVKEYGTAIDIAEALPIASHLKYMQELNKSKDLIFTNYKLMDLQTYCNQAIGAENIVEIDRVLDRYLV